MTELPTGYCELVQTLACHNLPLYYGELQFHLSPKRNAQRWISGPDEYTRRCLTALLLSGDPKVQTWTWWLVLRLVDREAVANPSFVRGFTARRSEEETSTELSPNPATVASWTAPPLDIDEHSETRNHLIELVKSSNPEVQRWTYWLQESLGHDDPLCDELTLLDYPGPILQH
ncbi:hypothetical protein DFH06DRAFT_1122293 [Mycena polygramma]|nr:hypothetical protein DFH06DRAFT_1122293 [Mycena polygramma]